MVEDMLRPPDRPQAEGGEPEPRKLRRWRLDHVPERQRHVQGHVLQAKKIVKNVSCHQLLFFFSSLMQWLTGP